MPDIIRLHSTGPVSVFVASFAEMVHYGYRLPDRNAWDILGHGERAPSIDIRPVYKPIQADIGGDAPFDSVYSGATGYVSLELVHFDWQVVQFLMQFSSHSENTRGFTHPIINTEYPGDVGTMTMLEGGWYVFLRFNKKGGMWGRQGNMPMGYLFHCAILDPASVIVGTGTAAKIRLAFNCMRRRYQSGLGLGAYSSSARYQYGEGCAASILYQDRDADVVDVWNVTGDILRSRFLNDSP